MAIRPRKPANDLEAQRGANPFGTLKRIEIESAEYDALTQTAKEHSNAANRQKTQLRKAIKQYALDNGLDSNAIIVVHDDAYKYAVTESEKINSEYIMTQYEEGYITREQLVQAMSFSKEDVLKWIGGDVMLAALERTKGKTLDIRNVTLTADQARSAPKVGVIKVSKPRQRVTSSATSSGAPKRRRLQPITRAKK